MVVGGWVPRSFFSSSLRAGEDPTKGRQQMTRRLISPSTNRCSPCCPLIRTSASAGGEEGRRCELRPLFSGIKGSCAKEIRFIWLAFLRVDKCRDMKGRKMTFQRRAYLRGVERKRARREMVSFESTTRRLLHPFHLPLEFSR